MSDFEPRDDTILALAESVVTLAESVVTLTRAIRDQPPPVINVAAPNVTVPDQPAPVVNVAGPVVNVPETPAAVVNVTVPDTQTVHIASLPPMRAKVRRGSDGRITEVIDG